MKAASDPNYAPQGFELIETKNNPYVFTLAVDAGALNLGERFLPFACYLGTFNVRTGKITVYTPSTKPPRGYKTAADYAIRFAMHTLTSKGRKFWRLA